MMNKHATDIPSAINLRPATPDDLDFFIKAHHAAYKPVITRQFGWDEALQDTFARDSFKNNNVTVIEHDGTPAGIVIWVESPGELYLHELFLLPAYQNKGIGSFILRLTISKAQAGNTALHLQVLKTNQAAARLYAHHGFVPCGETPTHIQMAFTGAPSGGL